MNDRKDTLIYNLISILTDEYANSEDGLEALLDILKDSVGMTVEEIFQYADDIVEGYLIEADGTTTLDEACPYCDCETEIGITGGICSECGKWVAPCSACAWLLKDKWNLKCDNCPFREEN